MRCSLPLAGREEPHTSMAIPFSMSEVPRSRAPSASRTGLDVNCETVASESSAAKSSNGSPVAW